MYVYVFKYVGIFVCMYVCLSPKQLALKSAVMDKSF